MGKRFSQRRRAALMAAVSASALLWNAPARADATWDPSVPDGSWSMAANWIGGVVPTTGTVAISFNDIASHTVNYDGSFATYPGSLLIANKGTGDAALVIDDANRTLLSHMNVGSDGNGIVYQNAGTVSGLTYVGSGSLGSGTYILSGGTLVPSELDIGLGSTGVFNQSGGTVGSPTSYLLMNVRGPTNGTGTYRLLGGTLYPSNEYVGGTFVQSDGTNFINAASIFERD